MSPFDRIVIIFNPQSTGDAPRRPRSCGRTWRVASRTCRCDLRPTEHAGHAREIAREVAATGRPLLVSVSGDGGYNEVVNGVLRVGQRPGGVRGAGGRERQRPPADDA